VTATDLVLTLTKRLREVKVVDALVEFHGPALDHLAVADRVTLANMSPEYGSTCAIFPVDAATMRYLRLTGRDEAQVALVEAYARAQGLWRDAGAPDPRYTSVVDFDLSKVEPCASGPRTPQSRVALKDIPCQLHDGDGDPVRRPCRALQRRHRGRRDHQLHQHLEPRGDARRRASSRRRPPRAASPRSPG
jgi:aconitase A